MGIQVVNVGPFAAGLDWTFVIPGQWYPYLYGVTATLTTAGAATSVPDETGNGITGTILAANGGYLGAQPGPFAGGANNYSVLGPDTFSGVNGEYARSAQSTLLGVTTCTFAGWVKPSATHSSASFNTYEAVGNLGNNDFVTVAHTPDNVSPVDAQIFASSGTNFSKGPWLTRGAWHHFAVTFDGANWTFYVDGVSVLTQAGDNPNGTAGSNQRFQACGGERGAFFGNAAAMGFWGSALSGANIATLAAANGSWSAYRTAALALTPIVLWGIGIPAAGSSRTVTLFVSDGTNTVAQFPASFAATTASSFIWSWQALGPGAQSSTDGQINSVPIPELSIAAGYQIGVQTLDLVGTDQWSKVTLWFDDGQPGGPGGGPGYGSGYINALLVPDYSHPGG